jgi:hypothetical protein
MSDKIAGLVKTAMMKGIGKVTAGEGRINWISKNIKNITW